jgi:hypothetical protein
MVEQPHNFVKQQIVKSILLFYSGPRLIQRSQAAGTAPISFSSSLLENKGLSDEEESDLKWSAASLYAGAADTVSKYISIIDHRA